MRGAKIKQSYILHSYRGYEITLETVRVVGEKKELLGGAVRATPSTMQTYDNGQRT